MYAGGVNFTSLLFMNVYRIYILLVWFDKRGEKFFFEFIYAPLLMIWQKGGEKFRVLYMHVYFISFFYTKRRRRILRIYICMFISIGIRAHMFCLYKKGRSIYVYFLIYAYICCLVYAYHWIFLLFIAMHELRGSFYEA